MAIQNEPTRIQIPFADSGTKNVIPDTNSTPSASQAASWTDGFPAQCSLPLSAGGIPPARADFNGIFNTMTQSIRYGQEGGVWAWDATVDYGTNRLVRGSDGLLYWSVAQSGPNVGGAVNPTTDNGTYWTPPQFKTLNVYDESNKGATTQWVRNYLAFRTIPRVLYVDSVNGDDSNDGKTAATAFKTVEHAQEMLTASDYIYFTPPYATVHLAMGSYGMLIGLPGCHVTYICDSPDEGTQCTGVDAHQSGNVVYIKGKLTINTGTISAVHGGNVFLLDNTQIVFQNQTTACIVSYNNSFVGNTSGDSVSFWFGVNVNVSSATIDVGNCGVVYFQGNVSFGGTVTLTGSGKSYNVAHSSVLRGIGSTTAIPPYTAGTVDSTSSFS